VGYRFCGCPLQQRLNSIATIIVAQVGRTTYAKYVWASKFQTADNCDN